MAGGGRRVGHTHHRKTRSQCSIDWTLPVDEFIDVSLPSEVKVENIINDEPANERDESMFALSKERENAMELPNSIDRFLFQFVNNPNGEGRWFPYILMRSFFSSGSHSLVSNALLVITGISWVVKRLARYPATSNIF